MSKIRSSLPYSPEAEQALLGCALLSPQGLDVVALQMAPDDFYVPAHATLVSYLIRIHGRQDGVDVVALADELDRNGDLVRIGGASYLTTLQNQCPSTGSALNYAKIVLEYAGRRRYITSAYEVQVKAQDPSISTDEIQDLARQRFGTLDMPILAGQPDPHVETFLEGPEEYDWLIDGLFERRDRLIVTGREGGGKTTLLRQLGVCGAAGIHPFQISNAIPPIRVLIIDAENSDKQIRRSLRALWIKAEQECRRLNIDAPDPDRLRINVKTDGLDLMQRVDQRWLAERCEANKPDLLLLGPLYKLHAGDPTEEGPARQVARTLDVIRHRYGCALMMEAHSPYTTSDGRRIGRPYGASLWSRWPEFGYAIAEDKDSPDEYSFEAWRGPRDERQWPKRLVRGGQWPWGSMDDPNGMDAGPPVRATGTDSRPRGRAVPVDELGMPPSLHLLRGGDPPGVV